MITQVNKIEIQYHFNDQSHSMNAFVHNECEKEFLLICKELTTILNIQLEIESEALKQGSLIDTWKALGKNNNQITFFLSILVLIISRIPVENQVLTNLQIENLKLDNAIKRKEVLKIMKDSIKAKKIEQEQIKIAADKISNDLKINIHKSNFYTKLNNYPKVISVSTKLFKDEKPVTDDESIERNDFDKFIIHEDILSDQLDEEAIIEIVAPILIEGRYKWRGIYKGEIFNFDMNDNKFKNSVFSKKIEFTNGTTIRCVLSQSRKIDDSGTIQIKNSKVLVVLDIFDDSKSIETKQGKSYRRSKKKDITQTELF
ncbi:hypothetical protein [Hymenobacter pini]|uniref:hypothetical protein n=1 Tax=Hymenobacter pini TaxID=2880879 RepID=UPI001CF52909|nr:hypothetical protein [Hymenobacter pini]MCA8829854.1 hypothetical protein [Hymenobacter pini]